MSEGRSSLAAAAAASTVRVSSIQDTDDDGVASDIYSHLAKFEESLDVELQGLHDMLGADAPSAPGVDVHGSFNTADGELMSREGDASKDNEPTGRRNNNRRRWNRRKNKRSGKAEHGNIAQSTPSRTSSLQRAIADRPDNEAVNGEERNLRIDAGENINGQVYTSGNAQRNPRPGRNANRKEHREKARQQPQREEQNLHPKDTSRAANSDTGKERRRTRPKPSSLQQRMRENGDAKNELAFPTAKAGQNVGQQQRGKGARQKSAWRRRQQQRKREQHQGNASDKTDKQTRVDTDKSLEDKPASSSNAVQKPPGGLSRRQRARRKKANNQQQKESSLQQKIREYHLAAWKERQTGSGM